MTLREAFEARIMKSGKMPARGDVMGTYRQIAEVVGCSPSTVRAIVSGYVRPTGPVAEAIAKELGVSL